jgi:hypothetical protein
MSNIADPNLIYRIPKRIIEETLGFLRSQGRRGHEGVILWPARLEENFCTVAECLIPRQITSRLMYRIPDDEVFRIIEYIAGKNLVIPIQVHSHPREAFHSETDDERAFVQHTNGISIVVPDFGNIDLEQFFGMIVVYSLVEGALWRELRHSEISDRFHLQQ